MLFMIYLLETMSLLNTRYEVRDISSADFYSRPGNFPMIYFTSTWHVVKIVPSHGNSVRSPRRQCSTTYWTFQLKCDRTNEKYIFPLVEALLFLAAGRRAKIDVPPNSLFVTVRFHYWRESDGRPINHLDLVFSQLHDDKLPVSVYMWYN